MPGKATMCYGNEILDTFVYVAAVTYPTIGSNLSATNTLTIPGVLPYDVLSASMIAPPAHLSLDNIYVSAANTATITWFTDSTGISGATVPVVFTVVRFENQNLGVAAFPSAIT